MPLGERWGSISPRASYMRSVCGCISASSAATEIMNTPRSDSTRAVTRVVRRVAISPPRSRRAARRICSRGLPFITFESASTASRCSSESSRGTSMTKR